MYIGNFSREIQMVEFTSSSSSSSSSSAVVVDEPTSSVDRWHIPIYDRNTWLCIKADSTTATTD